MINHLKFQSSVLMSISRAAGVYDIPMNIYVTYNPRSIELPEELHEVYFRLT